MSVTPSENLPRKERIAKRREFLRTYDTGIRQFGRFTVVFCSPNGLGHPRVGITATRKIGKAHVRNRARRWVREVYRRNRAALALEREAFDFVVNIKASAADTDFASFSEDLVRTIGRAHQAARKSFREA